VRAIGETTGSAPTPYPVPAPPPRPRRLPAWVAVVGPSVAVYGASRMVVFAALWMASRLVPSVGLASAVTAWDGGWYLTTARLGYPARLPMVDGHVGPSTVAFFPGYPLCIRAVHGLGLSYEAAGILVAGLAGLATVVLLRLLLERLWGRVAADRGVALFCFFPGAVALSLTYSEPLMLALTVGSLLALVSRRWVTAGVLAGLAGATRPNALALLPACIWAAVPALRNREWRAAAAPLLAPLGFLAFQGYLWAHTGHADAWLRTQQEGWDERIDIGATWGRIVEFARHPLVDVNITIAVAGTAFIVVALVLLVRARPPAAIVVYTVGVVALALSSHTLGARPRFVLTAFPLVTVFGRWLRASAFPAVIAGSAVLLGAMAILSVASRLATP
jgi:hypothetical protein